MNVRLRAAWRSPTTASAYFNGAWRTLQYGQAYVSGAWRTVVTFAQALTLSAFGGSGRSSTSTVSTGATAIPNGGVGPFTYAWTVTGSTNLTGISLSGQTTANLSITATVVSGNVGDSGTANLHCVATDSIGSTASADCTASFLIYDGKPGDTGTL